VSDRLLMNELNQITKVRRFLKEYILRDFFKYIKSNNESNSISESIYLRDMFKYSLLRKFGDVSCN
jgi:hypothetical protein